MNIDEDTATLLIAMSAATIDRRLGVARATLVLKGRSHTQPGLVAEVADTDADLRRSRREHPGLRGDRPGGHEGGNSRGEFCFTLTVTDIATGWTENRTVRNKAQIHVFGP